MNRLTKNEIKYYSALVNKKQRLEDQLFVVEGKRLVSEVISSNYEVKQFVATEKFANTNVEFMTHLDNKCDDIALCGEKDFERISDTKSPQGIAAITVIPRESNAETFDSKVIVALTGVSDPGNMGTILRTGEWFGVNEFIVDQDCVEVFNPKVVRSSMGALFHSNITSVENLEEILREKQKNGYKVLTADMTGTDINSYRFDGKNILVFANEAFGPSKEIVELSNEVISIPGRGKVESLNVASAAAIFLSRVSVK